jgi:hypothetical protein
LRVGGATSNMREFLRMIAGLAKIIFWGTIGALSSITDLLSFDVYSSNPKKSKNIERESSTYWNLLREDYDLIEEYIKDNILDFLHSHESGNLETISKYINKKEEKTININNGIMKIGPPFSKQKTQSVLDKMYNNREVKKIDPYKYQIF